MRTAQQALFWGWGQILWPFLQGRHLSKKSPNALKNSDPHERISKTVWYFCATPRPRP